MTYREALEYLDSFVNYERIDNYDYKASLKLDRMERLAKLLGNPHKNIPSIHIAGSKGKGSTAAYIHSILRAAGFKTGLYTSPHLVSFRERIRIDGELISEEDVDRILGRIREVIESSMKNERPTFFEVCTALAYIYFKEKKADFAVYEVGLGGRLDATNIIEPLVCAITPLSYEHTDRLGRTLKDIAGEKCGIIKDNSICVSAPQEGEALKVIEETCAKRSARLILAGRDIGFKEIASGEDGEVFSVRGPSAEYPRLESRLIGPHQIVNASVAIGVIEALKSRGVPVSSAAVVRGIGEATWEGRLEVVRDRPKIILDGAHNRASAATLAQAIKRIFKYERLILIFGASKDKDVNGMLEELLPLCDSVILTKSKILSRALDPNEIEKIMDAIGSIGKDITVTTGTEEAIDKALASANDEDLILVTGSLFVVGEIRPLVIARSLSQECLATKQSHNPIL